MYIKKMHISQKTYEHEVINTRLNSKLTSNVHNIHNMQYSNLYAVEN